MAKTKNEKIAELSAALLAAINAPVPVNPTCKISKSKFMAGLQCPKREYRQVRHPELAESVDDGPVLGKALALPLLLTRYSLRADVHIALVVPPRGTEELFAGKMRALYMAMPDDSLVVRDGKHFKIIKDGKAQAKLRQIPYLGPIRSALVVALIQTPHRFRTKRQLWVYCGLALETRTSVRALLQRSSGNCLQHVCSGSPRTSQPPSTICH